MKKTLNVGVGRADISPAVGTWLTGYAPARRAEIINDPLHLTAFAFEQDGVRAIVATADTCVIEDAFSAEVRRAMSEASGVPFEKIILSATHTHSGPALFDTPGGAPFDRDYAYGKFLPAAKAAAADATASLRPAVMGVGVTQSDVGVNRRQILTNGDVALGQEPLGSYDPTMTVVSFREPDGKPIGNIIHYGAHNTGAGANPEATRDWCGVMIDRLEAESGGVTAFFNGCEGDVGPRLANGGTTGSLKLTLELGGRAAIDAVRAWRSIREWRSGCELKTLSCDIKLPYKKLPAYEELMDEINSKGDPDKLVGLAVMEYEALSKRAEAMREGKLPGEARAFPIFAVSVGPVAFLPIPFEIFSMITLRISRHSPFAHTLSLSNANGWTLYFPSMDQIIRGGYEVWVFTKLSAFPFADDSEQHFVSQAAELLKRLKEK